MIVYLFFFVVFAIISQGTKKFSTSCFFMAFALLLIIGLRDMYTGTDTPDYVTNNFMRLRGISYEAMAREIEYKTEPLFFILTWCIGHVFDSYTVFLLFWAAFPAYSIYATLKRELKVSNDLWISYLVFFLLSLFSFFIAGMRQTVAISIVFFALRYIEEPITIKVIRESRFWKYMLCILFGYYIHNSIVIFAFLYPLIPVLQRQKPRWWFLIPIVSLFFVGNFIDLGQIGIVSSYLFNERYANYGTVYESSMSSSAFIMQLILFIICFVVRNKLIKQDSRNILLINLVFVGLVFQSLAGMIAEMFRMSYYFSIFYIILIPRVLRILSNNGKEPIYSIAFSILGLVFLFFLSSAHMPEYHFFF